MSASAPVVAAAPVASRGAVRWRLNGAPLVRGAVAAYLMLLVVLPLLVLAVRSVDNGAVGFWNAVSTPQSVAALRLSLLISLGVVVVNVIAGLIIAWMLVRDNFPGKNIVDAAIDLPFALPTIVAGLTLISLYGPKSPVGVNVAYTQAGIALALLFVTLPFTVRAVQPILAELDQEMEEAAAALGASGWTTVRRIILPSLLPAILSGAGLAFARAIGEFGSVVLISGNIPFKTEVAAVNIFSQVENDNISAAAALSVVLLLVSLLVLTAIALFEGWRERQ